jgi:hypothetical protein
VFFSHNKPANSTFSKINQRNEQGVQKDMHHGLMVPSWQPSQVACRSALDVEAIGAEMARSIRRRRQAYVAPFSSR